MRCWVVVLLLLAGFARFAVGWSAPALSAPEYQVKAVFLLNFTQFVEWPRDSLPDPQTPLRICVLGEDPFGSYLDETVRGESVNGHPLQVRHYRRVEDTEGCHVLFISGSESSRLESILAALRGRGILTVGDVEGFALKGGIIRFVTVGNRIRLRINLAAAKTANLTLSSKLLRPADLIRPGED